MSTPLIDINLMHAGYGDRVVLRDISLRVDSAQRWAIIGRNGTGKSTFVKTVAGLLAQSRGTVTVCGKDIARFRARERACRIAYVPQKPDAVIPYTVYDFVMLGRYARMGLFGMPDDVDRQAVAEALDFCDLRSLYARMMNTLSGGELQRALLAGALAQETPLLLLDEPTTFLDPAHERLFLRALRNAQEGRGIVTIMVTHDINTALSSCTHILALLDGAAHFCGDIGRFRELCPAILDTIFGISFSSFTGKKGEKTVYGTWGG